MFKVRIHKFTVFMFIPNVIIVHIIFHKMYPQNI